MSSGVSVAQFHNKYEVDNVEQFIRVKLFSREAYLSFLVKEFLCDISLIFITSS